MKTCTERALRMNPPTPPPSALLWSYCRPSLPSFIITVAVCRRSLDDCDEDHIRVSSQPERFLDYSLFFSVVPPAAAPRLRKTCVWLRGAAVNELELPRLVITRLGAASLHSHGPFKSSAPSASSAGRFNPLMPAVITNVKVFSVV